MRRIPGRARTGAAIALVVAVVAGASVMYLRRSPGVPSAPPADRGGAGAVAPSHPGGAAPATGGRPAEANQGGGSIQPVPVAVSAGIDNWAIGVYQLQGRDLQHVGGGWARTRGASRDVVALNLSLTVGGSPFLVAVDGQGVFVGVTSGGRTSWLALSELAGGLPSSPIGLGLGVAQPGAPQRSVMSGDQRFDVFESYGDAGVAGSTSLASLDETWVDASGHAARLVRFADVSTSGAPRESLVIVADRLDAAWVPPSQFARAWTIPTPAAVRRLMRMPTPRIVSQPPPPAIQLASFAQKIVPAKPLPGQRPPLAPPEECKGILSNGRVWKFPCSRIQPPLPPRRPVNLPEFGGVPPSPAPSSSRRPATPGQLESVVNCFEDAASGPVGLGVQTAARGGVVGAVVGVAIGLHGLKRLGDCLDGALTGGHGDPHLYTFDGFRYDLQAIGEFVHLESREFEVQLRLLGEKGHATWIFATAVKTRLHVVEAYYRSRSRPGDSTFVIIDGVMTEIDGNGVTLSDGTFVQQRPTSKGSDNVLVVAPDGSYAVIENLAVSQNVFIDLAPGTNVQGGLGGIANGVAADDFSLRDRTQLSLAELATIQGLYGRFAQSWRVRPARRLFTQGSASDFLTEAYTALPSAVTHLSGLDASRARQARLECEKRGITSGPMLEDCMYDVAVTKDGRWADQAANSLVHSHLAGRSAAGRRRIELVRSQPGAPEVPASGAGFQVPPAVRAGSPVDIPWAGRDLPDGLIFITTPETPANQYPLTNAHASGRGSPARLVAPADAGRYEIRYFDTANGTIVSRTALVVTDAAVVVDAPPSVSAGAVFGLSWRGPNAPNDLVFVASVDSPGNRYPLENRHAAAAGPSGRLIAPARPGTYEIRYFSAANGSPLARVPLTVSSATVRLAAPAEVAAGARIEFSWEGPNAPGDLIFIARPNAPGNQYPLEDRHATSRGASGVLTAPDAAGEYELRYFSYQNGAVLYRQPLRVR